jgi:hypothetical protein
MIGPVLYAAAFFLFLIRPATAGGRTAVQTVSAAAKTLPTTELVKGKSPQGSRAAVQIEQCQYLLYSAAELASSSSPAATTVQTVSAAAKTLPTTPTRVR